MRYTGFRRLGYQKMMRSALVMLLNWILGGVEARQERQVTALVVGLPDRI